MVCRNSVELLFRKTTKGNPGIKAPTPDRRIIYSTEFWRLHPFCKRAEKETVSTTVETMTCGLITPSERLFYFIDIDMPHVFAFDKVDDIFTYISGMISNALERPYCPDNIQ